MAGQSNKNSDKLSELEELKARIIAEAKAEAERIIAEAKREVADNKEPVPPEVQNANAEGEEMVNIRLPYKKGENVLYVCVNGENLLIPRGKEVRIKKKYYWVLQQAEEQQERAMRLMQGLADDYDAKRTDF